MSDSGRSHPTPEAPTDPDLALIVERWEQLPEAVRAGIVAMIRASVPPFSNPQKPPPDPERGRR